jgi:hypothetical protein
LAQATPVTITQATGGRVYRVMDWGGWIVLVLLAAIFVGTGIFIRQAVHAHHPVLSDAILLGSFALTFIWALLYYSLRVSVHAMITSEGLTLVHGPWRHVAFWRDVTRLSEWTSLTEGIRYQWIAVQTANGTRLQVRQDLVPDFAAFRSDLLTHLAELIVPPDSVTDLSLPLVMTSDVSRLVTLWGMVMTAGIIGGVLLISFLPDLLIIGGVVLAIGVLSFGIALGTMIFRQSVTVSREGIETRRGPLRRHLAWAAVYALEREPGSGLRGTLGILGRGVLMILFRVDRRSVVVPGAERSLSAINVRGNSGEHVRLREASYHHPEWLRQRLRLQVAALHAAATPAAPRVKPLPQTGPLSPDAVLPPDPMETSTLWLRESGEFDPFRQRGN